MACPLLDKLPAEIRTKIWEYALTFDKPLQHLTKMMPFTRMKTGSTGHGSGALPGQDTVDDVPDPYDEFLKRNRVNTSILTANKRIYLEAVKVFYEANTIMFDAHLCEVVEDMGKVAVPEDSDLTLATRVVAELAVSPYRIVSGGLDPASDKAITLALGGLEDIFPRLKSGIVYLYTDSSVLPAAELFYWVNAGRIQFPQGEAKFDGVGSVIVFTKQHPKIEFRVQCETIMEHWAKCAAKYYPMNDKRAGPWTAFRLYNELKRNPRDPLLKLMKSYQDQDQMLHRIVQPNGYPSYPLEEFEYWTCVEWNMHRSLLERRMGTDD